ncbi:MAG: YhfC family intramembrane metalloprotease [Clostridiales bacterium]|jgi:uncharacterized membrane protein YhfC|nr:YhfC family intramembrane metalloprotease [Clostridiales bacterium]
MVPGLSILFMAISFLISFGFPAVLFLIFRKRFKTRIVPLLLGIAGFTLFVLVLEQFLHAAVLRRDASGAITLMAQPAIYVLYGCFAAGIFEETARFIAFNILKRKRKKTDAVLLNSEGEVVTTFPDLQERRGVGDALAYGIGHGGIEAVLLLGAAMLNNIIFSVMINAGTLPALTGSQQDVITNAVSTLTTTQPYMFLLGGIERIPAVTIQISLSVLVWLAVGDKRRIWLFPAAICLHALLDVPAALMQCGVLNSAVAVEIILAVSAVVLTGLAVMAYKRFNSEVGSETA